MIDGAGSITHGNTLALRENASSILKSAHRAGVEELKRPGLEKRSLMPTKLIS